MKFIVILSWIALLCPSLLHAGTTRLQLGDREVVDCDFTNAPYCNGDAPLGQVHYYNTNGGWQRYYCRIPLPAFLHGQAVTEATLSVYEVHYDWSRDFKATINRLANPLTEYYESHRDPLQAPSLIGTANYDTVSQFAGYEGWLDFRVTSLVGGWVNGEFPNDGFVIRILDENQLTYTVFLLAQSGSLDRPHRPILSITGPTIPDTLMVSDESSYWALLNGPGGMPNAFGVLPSADGTGSTFLYAAIFGSGVFLSTDQGTSWTAANEGLTSLDLYTLATSSTFSATDKTILFAGTAGGGVFFSSDAGTSWQGGKIGLTDCYVTTIANSKTSLFAGTFGGGVYRSIDGGMQWATMNNGLQHLYVNALALVGENLFAATYGGIFLSTDEGNNWSAMNDGLNGASTKSLVVSGTTLLTGTFNTGVFRSTNYGRTWQAANTGLPYKPGYVFALSGKNIFVGTWDGYGTTDGGVFLSTNDGMVWTAQNSGLPQSAIVRGLGVCGGYLFASTTEGVWRRSLSDIVTDIKSEARFPEQTSLLQNFPNPFNPTSDIRFLVSQSGHVRLTVYDLLGREVAVLVDSERMPGTYQVTFDASGLSSGVYLYRLTSGENALTRKMLVLK